ILARWIMKFLLVIFLFINFAYQLLLYVLCDNQRKKPLPDCVNDIYDSTRYQTFLAYKSDQRKLSLIQKLITMGIDLILIYSNFFSFIESITHQPYFIVIITFLILFVINTILEYIFEYYTIFTIEEKYGMNKKDHYEFNKDFFINLLLEFALSIVLYLFICFVCESMAHYSISHQITYVQSFLIACGIVFILALIIILFSFLSYLGLKSQYQFHELEEGELRSKIEAMMIDCKKKVKKIQVYDESKKSTTKNAFLLKLLWIREFGIADNFLNENSENELLAVLAHEIGHLKHRKDRYDFLKYFILLILFSLFVWILPHIELFARFNEIMLTSFNLSYNNYYLSFLVISIFLEPILIPFTALFNLISRKHEYEADENTIKMGYGEDLIRTFKQLSSDELIDVNPNAFVEMMTYDHPGMYHRIHAIQNHLKDVLN
ncbi:MAG: M48 family metalloprotease, partial [Traorella sp.]